MSKSQATLLAKPGFSDPSRDDALCTHGIAQFGVGNVGKTGDGSMSYLSFFDPSLHHAIVNVFWLNRRLDALLSCRAQPLCTTVPLVRCEHNDLPDGSLDCSHTPAGSPGRGGLTSLNNFFHLFAICILVLFNKYNSHNTAHQNTGANPNHPCVLWCIHLCFLAPHRIYIINKFIKA